MVAQTTDPPKITKKKKKTVFRRTLARRQFIKSRL